MNLCALSTEIRQGIAPKGLTFYNNRRKKRKFLSMFALTNETMGIALYH